MFPGDAVRAGAGPSGSPADFAGPLFIVLNACSGRADVDATRATIEKELTAARCEHQFHLVHHASELSGVARRAVALAQAHSGIVVAAGGDGTINAVAQATLGSRCALGVLPQGTFNYFSRALGIPGDTAQAVRAMLRARAQPVQIGLVNGRVFLVNASLGLYPQLLHDREAWKREYGRSRLVALWAGLATLLREHRQLHLQIGQAGETRAIRTPTLFVGNNRLQLERLGVAAAQQLGQGELVGITVRPIGTFALLWLGLRGAFGRLGDAGHVTSFGFRRITVGSARRRGRHKVRVAIDGEIVWLEAPLEFAVAPEPLPVLIPEPLCESERDGAPEPRQALEKSA